MRLLELMVRVQAKPRFTAAELAKKFGVSRRTILRDLQVLSGMGVPLRSTPGPGGGYSLLRGESRFTTWAQKIAVRTASTELRRKRWRDVSLQEVLDRYGTHSGESDRLADEQPTPEQLTMRSTMVATVRRFVDDELTDKQRKAIVAVMFEGMPLEEAARRMETNRGALYKLMHDARRRLKKRMEAEGLSAQDVLGRSARGKNLRVWTV